MPTVLSLSVCLKNSSTISLIPSLTLSVNLVTCHQARLATLALIAVLWVPDVLPLLSPYMQPLPFVSPQPLRLPQLLAPALPDQALLLLSGCPAQARNMGLREALTLQKQSTDCVR